MELSIDPHATLAELQFTLFMAAISALVELAKTTDKDHIKLRALTEVARLCNPAKRSTAQSSSPKAPAPTPHGTRSASDGPQAPALSHTSAHPDASLAVARAPGSEGKERSPARATGIGSPRRPKPVSPAPTEPLESLLPLNRRQRRFLARLEANERKRAARCAA